MSTNNLEEFIKIITPNVPDIKLPSIDEIKEWENEKNRWLFAVGPVNGDECGGFETDAMKMAIMRYNKQDADAGLKYEERTPIIIFVNSPGGDLWGTYSLVRVMKISETPIYTVNIEEASSAGNLILISGHKKFALPGTYSLVHSGSAGFQGTKEQVESAQKAGEKLTKRTTEWILSNTKITRKDYNKYAPKDWWFLDDEQVEYGIVDRMFETLDIESELKKISKPISEDEHEQENQGQD